MHCKKYEIMLDVLSTVCPSGYTTTIEGIAEIRMVKEFPGFMYRYTKPEEEYEDIIKEVYPEPGYDLFICQDSYNSEVFSCSYLGEDHLYPSGGYYIDTSLFKFTGRSDGSKRKVWIFHGDSTAGKSFLAEKIRTERLTVYETDSSEKLPEVITEDIIVLGNKYDFTQEDIIEKIFEFEKAEIVSVKFDILW